MAAAGEDAAARLKGRPPGTACCRQQQYRSICGLQPPSPASPGPHRRVALSHPHNWWRNPSAVLCPRDEERGIRGSRRLLGDQGAILSLWGKGIGVNLAIWQPHPIVTRLLIWLPDATGGEEAQCRIQARRSRPEHEVGGCIGVVRASFEKSMAPQREKIGERSGRGRLEFLRRRVV